MSEGNAASTVREFLDIFKAMQDAARSLKAYREWMSLFHSKPQHTRCSLCGMVHHSALPCPVSEHQVHREEAGWHGGRNVQLELSTARMHLRRKQSENQKAKIYSVSCTRSSLRHIIQCTSTFEGRTYTEILGWLPVNTYRHVVSRVRE